MDEDQAALLKIQAAEAGQEQPKGQDEIED